MTPSKHLVISSYNHDVDELVKLGIPFTIYDQSDDLRIAEELVLQYGAIRKNNCGHSLSNMFEFISENYEKLPDILIFAKSNIVPRHCTAEYFKSNIYNNYYTHLYHEDNPRIVTDSSDYPLPGVFLEKNNSWYAYTKDHSLFCNYNDLYNFLFESNQEPQWIQFCPGACFIVESERILRYPKSFWQTLNRITSYIYFPSEAYMVERMLPAIFLSRLPLQLWIHDLEEANSKLDGLLKSKIRHSCRPNFYKAFLIKILQAVR